MQWVHLHSQGGEKNRRNLHGKFVSAPPAHQVHPQTEQESIFRTFFAVLGRFGASVSNFRRVLMAATKKDRQLFFRKSAPQTKSWLRLCQTVWSPCYTRAESDFSLLSCVAALGLELLSCAIDVGWAYVLTLIKAVYYYYYYKAATFGKMTLNWIELSKV